MYLKDHWEKIYSEKDATALTWYQRKPDVSLGLFKKSELPVTASVIDVGAGASTLVDNLIEQGFSKITLCDLAANALIQTKNRLRNKSEQLKWIVADINRVELEDVYDLWHDRAVYHFLLGEKDQQKYYANLLRSTLIGSCFIISTFAEDGPLKCSGLEIVRYSKQDLIDRFSLNFECLDFVKETHLSPLEREQKFNYWLFRRVS